MAGETGFARYILWRLGITVPVVLGVVTLVFLLIHLIPGDPVEMMLGETAQAADKVRLRQELGLDQPIGEQYVDFLSGLLHGDLGRSLHIRQPVGRLIMERLPATVELAVAAIIIAVLLSFSLGCVAALHQNSLWDRACQLLAIAGACIPNFWLGPLLIIQFSLKLDWLPVGGREGLAHLVLPALTLGLSLSAVLARMMRASLLEVIREEYILAARAKGLGTVQVLLRHALRNALIPVLTILGLQIGGILSGSIIVETIFAWPGLGRLTLQAITSRDYPLVQGCVLVIALSYVLVNLLTDVAYAMVDPRIRLGRK